MHRRVVVTGMGAITPIGKNVDEFWNNAKKGQNGIDFIKSYFNTDKFKVKIAAEIKDYNAEDYADKRETKRMDKFTILAVGAAAEAVLDSGIDMESIDKTRVGVFVGSGIGGLHTIEEQVIRMYEKGPSKVSPFFVPLCITNIAAGNIAIKFGAKGPCLSINTACATGTNCIGEAYRSIKHGYMDACIAGGTEASITQIGMAGFTTITALTSCNNPKRASIPFDKERSGFVIGEGAGILILEDLDSALRRGAKIYGEIAGYGASSDAYHMTAPTENGEGIISAMNTAMSEAGIRPEDISYINAHGTSTPANDKTETIAVKTVFGDYAKSVPISSTKSMIGHLLGAAGAVESIITIKSLQEGFITPTIGYETADEECDLDYVPNIGRNCEIKYALNNSLAFGGHNGSLCFKRWEGC